MVNLKHNYSNTIYIYTLAFRVRSNLARSFFSSDCLNSLMAIISLSSANACVENFMLFIVIE